jgi:hypothetical protein
MGGLPPFGLKGRHQSLRYPCKARMVMPRICSWHVGSELRNVTDSEAQRMKLPELKVGQADFRLD